MLSSCWLTSPFSGCFNTAIKGVVGGVHDSSDVGFTRTRMSQIPLAHEKSLANGSAEGFPSTGISLGGGRGAPGIVTTIAPKSTANQENKAPPPPPPPSGQQEEKCNQQESSQQPQTPRKSKSMGRLHGSGGGVTAGEGGFEGGAQNAPADNKEREGGYPPTAFRGHRRVPSDGVAWRHSKAMESEMENDDRFMKRTYKSEYRKKFRPFSQYQYVDGKFHKSKADGESPNTWYKEVLELRKQAGQYRCRGWGVETASDRMAEIYTKQVELWEQVSRRSSLQALSLASAAPSRPISKAEKEIENSRRSSPIKHARDRPSTAPAKQKPAPVHKPADKIDGKAPQKESTTPRHHYEKTTGAGDGSIITSPSRDRIEPIIINTDWSTRRSPRKIPPLTSPVKDGAANKRRSPRAISVARTSSAKEHKTPTKAPALGKTAVSSSSAGRKADIVGRSVSVGPENRSPKRTSRPPSSTHPQAPAPKTERRPRPTSLTTSSRRKGADSAISHHEAKKPSKKPLDISASPKRSADLKSRDEKRQSSVEEEKKDKDGKEAKDAFKEAAGRKSTPEPRFDPEKYEPVVKTPPEPTRVKSPDQVMVKSPDPVNWTVPLDTGKTFTVTSNVPEGEASRGTPSSEHRPPLESRSRQTPEPTKVYQGSLAGTPITTAGTCSSAPSASTATATIVSTSSHLPSKVEPASSIKTIAPSVPTSVPADILKEPVSGVFTESSILPPSNTKPDDEKKTNEKPTEISSLSTASKPLDSKPLSSIKETSPQPSESPKPYQEMPKPSEVLEAKISPASSISSSIGLSSGILEVVGSIDTNDNFSDSLFQNAQKNAALLTIGSGEEVGESDQLSGKLGTENTDNYESKDELLTLNDSNETMLETANILQVSDITMEKKDNIELKNNSISLSEDYQFNKEVSEISEFVSHESDISDYDDYDNLNVENKHDIEPVEEPDFYSKERLSEPYSSSSSIANLDASIEEADLSSGTIIEEATEKKPENILESSSDEIMQHNVIPKTYDNESDLFSSAVAQNQFGEQEHDDNKMFDSPEFTDNIATKYISEKDEVPSDLKIVSQVEEDEYFQKQNIYGSKSEVQDSYAEENTQFSENVDKSLSPSESTENMPVFNNTEIKTSQFWPNEEKINIEQNIETLEINESISNLSERANELSSSDEEEFNQDYSRKEYLKQEDSKTEYLHQELSYHHEDKTQSFEFVQNTNMEDFKSSNDEDVSEYQTEYENQPSQSTISFENDNKEERNDIDADEIKEVFKQENIVEKEFAYHENSEDESSNNSLNDNVANLHHNKKVFEPDVSMKIDQSLHSVEYPIESQNINEVKSDFSPSEVFGNDFKYLGNETSSVNFTESSFNFNQNVIDNIEGKQVLDDYIDNGSENLPPNYLINITDSGNLDALHNTEVKFTDVDKLSSENAEPYSPNVEAYNKVLDDDSSDRNSSPDIDESSKNATLSDPDKVETVTDYYESSEVKQLSFNENFSERNVNYEEYSFDTNYPLGGYPVKEKHNYEMDSQEDDQLSVNDNKEHDEDERYSNNGASYERYSNYDVSYNEDERYSNNDASDEDEVSIKSVNNNDAIQEQEIAEKEEVTRNETTLEQFYEKRDTFEQSDYDSLTQKNKLEQENFSYVKENYSDIDSNNQGVENLLDNDNVHHSPSSNSVLLKKRVSFSIAEESDDESISSSTESINGEVKDEISNHTVDTSVSKVKYDTDDDDDDGEDKASETYVSVNKDQFEPSNFKDYSFTENYDYHRHNDDVDVPFSSKVPTIEGNQFTENEIEKRDTGEYLNFEERTTITEVMSPCVKQNEFFEEMSERSEVVSSDVDIDDSPNTGATLSAYDHNQFNDGFDKRVSYNDFDEKLFGTDSSLYKHKSNSFNDEKLDNERSDEFAARFSSINSTPFGNEATRSESKSNFNDIKEQENNADDKYIGNFTERIESKELNIFTEYEGESNVSQIQGMQEESSELGAHAKIESSNDMDILLSKGSYDFSEENTKDRELLYSGQSDKYDFSEDEPLESERSQILSKRQLNDIPDTNAQLSVDASKFESSHDERFLAQDAKHTVEDSDNNSDDTESDNFENKEKNIAKRLFATDEKVPAVNQHDEFSYIKYSPSSVTSNANSFNIDSYDANIADGEGATDDNDSIRKDNYSPYDYNAHDDKFDVPQYNTSKYEKSLDMDAENHISVAGGISNEANFAHDYYSYKRIEEPTTFKSDEQHRPISGTTDITFAVGTADKHFDENEIRESSEFRSDDPRLFVNADLQYDLLPKESFQSPSPSDNSAFSKYWPSSNGRGSSPKEQLHQIDHKLNPFNNNASFYQSSDKDEEEDSSLEIVNNKYQNNNGNINSFTNNFETTKIQTFENNSPFKTNYRENGLDSQEEEYDSYESSDSMVIRHDVSSLNQNMHIDEAYNTLSADESQPTYQEKMPKENSFEADTFSPTTSPWHTN